MRTVPIADKSWGEMEEGLDLNQKHRPLQFNNGSYGGDSLERVTKRVLWWVNN